MSNLGLEFGVNPQTWLINSQIYKNLRIITKKLWAIRDQLKYEMKCEWNGWRMSNL